MKKIISVFLAQILLISLFCSCGKNDGVNEKIRIVCTTFPQYDFAKNIAGDRAEITMLDSSTDIHSFEPTADNILAIASADIFFYIGGISDSWVEKALISSGNKKLVSVPLIDCIEALNEETVEGMQSDEEEETEKDEHIWLSLRNARLMAGCICDNMCTVDPKNAEYYKNNAEDYTDRLDALDKQYENTVGNSAEKVLLFADRFPFRYLVDDYGIDYYAAFSGCSSETEASFETVTFLINKVKELSLQYILVTESSDGSIAKTISAETGAKTLIMNSCQSVHGDEVSGADYIEIMTENLNVLSQALA